MLSPLLYVNGFQVMPGDNVEVDCLLHTTLAVEVGSRFTLRDGHKTSGFYYSLNIILQSNLFPVATGVCTKIIS